MEKLAIINRALIATGSLPLDKKADGSDEWIVADSSFDRAIEYLISEHKWPFATESVDLTSTGSSSFKDFSYIYAYPANAWHLRTIWYEDSQTTATYEIVGNVIHAYVETGLQALYVKKPSLVSDPAWHPQASEVLTLMVEVGLLRGLNEDFAEAERREARAEAMLRKAAARVDQQTPARNLYRPNMTIQRRVRRGC